MSCLNTGFRTANKECHRNYVLISEEQHWKSPAKKLEEEKRTRLQDYKIFRPELSSPQTNNWDQ